MKLLKMRPPSCYTIPKDDIDDTCNLPKSKMKGYYFYAKKY